MEPGLPIPVVITAFADKSFSFIMKTPPASVLIKKAAKLDKKFEHRDSHKSKPKSPTAKTKNASIKKQNR